MSRRSAGAAGLAREGPVFAVLGEETRLALVARLAARGLQSITRLATGSDVTRQAITRHLHVLAGTGLAHDVRRGGNASGSSTWKGWNRRAAGSTRSRSGGTRRSIV